MFRSIKAKMMALTAGILVAAFAAFTYYTQHEFQQGMTEAEENSARNMIHMAMLTLESNYNDLLYHREKSLESHKSQLRDILSIVEGLIKDRMTKVEKGMITEETAKKEVFDEIAMMKYGNSDYIFALDYNYRVMSHPDPAMIGKDMSDSRDAEGNLLVPEMVKAARKNKDGGYTRYLWRRLGEGRPIEKLSYSKDVPRWKCVLGTGVYIDEIEKEAQRKLAEMIKGLGETFSKIRIAKTGYMFILDGKKKMIVHPTLSGQDFAEVRNPSTGNYLADDLIAASANPDTPMEYLWDRPDHKGQYIFPKECYVKYFKPLDWYVASSVYKDEITLPAKTIISRQSYMMVIILYLGLLLTYLFVDRIARPLVELTDYAKELPSHDFTSPGKKDSGIAHLPGGYRDEVGRLAEAFIYMERSLKDNILKLTETTAVKERIESELTIAHDIQMSILPKIFPAFPARLEFDINATIEPAKEVGGDFYDFFFIDDDHFCFVIGDVSGKGVPASLFMAVTKTLIKATATGDKGPGKILSKVNDELAHGNEMCMFVTIFLGIMNTVTGELWYANGGHNPPILISEGGKVSFLRKEGELVIGAMEGMHYGETQLFLEPGDTIFTYTDGVTEAMDAGERQFSEQRLLKEVAGLRDRPIKEIIEGVRENVFVHASGVPQSDDITMMAVRYNGKSS
ncbi:MAG: cache domain-containing protein [Nitrospirae bacterium]|nr:cache domain-containing protein [Nitrospirota bacterium]